MLSRSPMISVQCSEDDNGQQPEQYVNQYQKYLDEQLDWLTVDHDDLMQDILNQIATPKYHPSMSRIDKWEQEAIKRIQHTAFLARQALVDALDQHVFKVKQSLETLTEKLREARDRIKSFNENDIQEWTIILQGLKAMPVFPVTIDKDNNIHGLCIDLRDHPRRTSHSEANSDKSTLTSLLSIIPDPIDSTSISTTPEYETISTNVTKKSNINSRKVKFEDVSSDKADNITPGGVLIIREEHYDKPTTPYILEVRTETPSGT